MENRKILLLLVFSMFLTSCSQKIQLSETNAKAATIYENDNIEIKIADNIEEKENVYKIILDALQKIDDFSSIENIRIEVSKKYITPNVEQENTIKCDAQFIEREEFKKELIKESYGIHDIWVAEGLCGEIFDLENNADFSKYYSNYDFSLFGVRFLEPFSSQEEIDNVRSASINLVRYLIQDGKKDKLLENQIEVSDMEKWAKDRGIDLDYQRDIQNLMNRMEVLNKPSQLVIDTVEDTNGFRINIDKNKIDKQYDTAEKIEQIILRFDTDVLAIKTAIEEEAPNFYSDYKEILTNVPKIDYIFDKDLGGGYYFKDQTEIYLGHLTTQAHEYCHFLFYEPFINNDIPIKKPPWLDEGMAEYFNSIYSNAYVKSMKDLFTDTANYTRLDSQEEKDLADKVLNVFLKNNIDIDNPEEVGKHRDKRIIVNHITWIYSYNYFYKIMDDGDEIDDILIERQGTSMAPMDEGNRINYIKNFSFTNYLFEEYGLEKILYLNVADFSELSYEEFFGKSLEELEKDWNNYILENIKDIESIL